MTESHSYKIPHYVIGDFKGLESIGIGAGGMVSRGKLQDFGEIALKQFVYSRDNPLDKFKKEIDVLIEHRHPNIINLFGILWNGQDQSIYLGYVMEYVEGGSLHDVIHKNTRPYDSLQIYKWIDQIARGLQFLHGNGIIHRDIKPENILVTGNHLKLADFGIAKDIDTTTTAGAGTLRYMAPEVFLGKCYPSSDIYSLAIVIWEIFHRQKPYYELGNVPFMTLTDKITDGTRPTIESEEMDGNVAILMQKCWQKSPENRPPIREIVEYFEEKIDSPDQLTVRSNIEVSEHMESLTEQMDITLTEQNVNRTVTVRQPPEGTKIKGIVDFFGNNSNKHNHLQNQNVDLDNLLEKTVIDMNKLHKVAVNSPRGEKQIEKEERLILIDQDKPKSHHEKEDTILILGGYDGKNGFDDLLLLKENNWSKISLKLSRKIAGHGTVYLNEEIYILGGNLGNRTCKLDKNFKWVRLVHMNEERWYITNSCLEWNGFIWVFGGSSDDKAEKSLKSVERYDPKEKKWTEMPSMNHARKRAAAVVWNGKLIICGGWCDGKALKSVECFDPESGIWTELDELPTPVSGHVVILYRNRLILIGAINSIWELNNFGGKQVWKELPSMKNVRSSFSAVVFNDEIYVIGGYNGKKRLSETEIFDGTKWRDGPDLPHQSSFMSAIAIPQTFADSLFNYKS